MEVEKYLALPKNYSLSNAKQWIKRAMKGLQMDSPFECWKDKESFKFDDGINYCRLVTDFNKEAPEILWNEGMRGDNGYAQVIEINESHYYLYYKQSEEG